ncbi:carbohydrate kinase family protein [Consotaella salsifontis]|uniref:Sugar or nucleoside kinase, ribokinase family n=1 Tax=Consotaella salsifontis TaxID=1365950 RepID=A0A1T4T718_9HYPH|nr:carbohydrate kinase family protein [Consotaella salsifontis]SKA35958.1 Sugar or nucleoside kinase, ribokinase family [Consotaella salsifontis]
MTESSRLATERSGILAIGNLIVDKTHRISSYPAESLLALISESAASVGGGAANVLFDLARVDPSLKLAVAGLVGDDEDGRFLRGEFSKSDIDTSHVVVQPGATTSFTHVMISQANATRTFFHSHGANSRLDAGFCARLDHPARIAHLAYLLLLEGLDIEDAEYGSAGARALAMLKAKGFRTSLDLVSDNEASRYARFVVPALPHTDYLIVNDVEAAHLSGVALPQGDRPDWEAMDRAARAILAMGVGELVAIHCPAGAVAATADGAARHQPSYPVPKEEMVSALGAGDAFCAGVLYGLHEGHDVAMCLKLGTALAHFNLFAASAAGGAVPLDRLLDLIRRYD